MVNKGQKLIEKWMVHVILKFQMCTVGPVSRTVLEFGRCAFLAFLAPFSIQRKKARKTENWSPTMKLQQFSKIQRTDMKLAGKL